MNIRIKLIENGKLPEYKTFGSAGADCYARIDKKIIIRPKTVETIPLGFAVEIPQGYELQIRGRSGLARKNNVQVFNSPGTIDSDYRGECGAILYNASDEDFIVNPGDRIAQAVIAPVIQAVWIVENELSSTDRGMGGFGSTGVSENFYFFTDIKEACKTRGQSVLIDGKIAGIVIDVEEVRGPKGDYINFIFKAYDSKGTMYEMSNVEAYNRVSMNGHKFGRKL